VSPPRSHVDKGNAFYELVKTPACEGRAVQRGFAKAVHGGELQLVRGSELSPRNVRRSLLHFARVLAGSMDPAWRPVAGPRFVLDSKLGRRVDGLGRIPLFFPTFETLRLPFLPRSPPPPPFTSRLLLSSCLWLGLREPISTNLRYGVDLARVA